MEASKLRNREREGVDFSIRVMPRETSAAIIAPHGGMIEPGTSDIAAAIAGNDYGLYCFEGLRDRPHSDLHITSANFREPKCVELVAECNLVVAVHGMDGKERQLVGVGGLDQTCAMQFASASKRQDFRLRSSRAVRWRD